MKMEVKDFAFFVTGGEVTCRFIHSSVTLLGLKVYLNFERVWAKNLGLKNGLK